MSTELTPSEVATAVVPLLAAEADQVRGAVVLRGFLHAEGRPTTGPDARPGEITVSSDARVRLYADETFRTWYEFNGGDILHHVRGAGSDLYYAMDLVWVKREATVTKSRRDHACLFAKADEDEWTDDPGAGPRKKSFP